MTDPLLASRADLEIVWRPLTEAELPQAMSLLQRASALLLQAEPTVADGLANGYLSPLVVGTVVAQIVKRFLENPSGATSMSTGPFSVSFVDRYQSADGSSQIKGGLQVTKSDLDSLRPKTPHVGSIRLAAGLARTRNAYGQVVEAQELTDLDVASDSYFPGYGGEGWGEGAAGRDT